MSVIPMLAVQDAALALAFYQEVFQAEEINRIVTEEGRISHAEVIIGDARIMIADEFPGHNVSAKTLGGTPVIIYLYVKDADDTVDRAAAAGAISLRPVDNQPHGDRVGKIEDPFGHVWMVAAPISAVQP